MVIGNHSAPKMKNKASALLKRAFTFIVTMMKAKAMALKGKGSAMKTRLILFRLLHNRKILIRAISNKIHALMAQEKGASQGKQDNSKAIALYNAEKDDVSPPLTHVELAEPDEDDGYPDLRHSLFDEDDNDEIANGTGSVIDLIRNSREDGSDFNLEDEIDHVADMFIKRFHKQMKMQKLESFKRYQEMLERGV